MFTVIIFIVCGWDGMAADKHIPQWLKEETGNDIIIENEDKSRPEEDANTSDHNSDSEQSDEETEQTEIDMPNNYNLGKDNNTKWRKEPHTPNVRTRAHNIVIHQPGPKRDAKMPKYALTVSTVL
jgi:hypothetical protein